MEDYYLIARVTGSSGKEGFVKIQSYSDFPDRFFELKYVYIDFFDEKKKFIIEDVIKKKDYYLVRFRNFNSEKDVELLKGKAVFVDKENLKKLPEGEFFIHDLIGSSVFKNDELLGTIKDVLTLPANDVYVVIDPEGNELLVPALREIILSFDPDTKVLILKPGEDLYETDED